MQLTQQSIKYRIHNYKKQNIQKKLVKVATLTVQTVGREANSAQSSVDGIVAITEAALLRWTSMVICYIKNTVALLSPGCSYPGPYPSHQRMSTWPQAPRVLTHKGEKWKKDAKEKYQDYTVVSCEAKKEQSELSKTNHATNYCVSFTWVIVFVIWRHNHSQYLSTRINF